MKIIIYTLLLTLIVFIFSCNNDSGPVLPVNSGTENDPPAKPSNPSPPDTSTNVYHFVTLSWSCSDPDLGDTLKYDVYFSQFNPPQTLAVGNYAYTTYDYGGVQRGTTFYWKVVAKDNHGASTSGNIWSFTTEP